MAYRFIVLNPDKLKVFLPLTQEKIKFLISKICDLKIYKPGEELDISNGGVLYYGNLEYKKNDIK